VEERQDGRGLTVVADREPAERDEPCLRPLHNPPVPAQPLAGLHASARDAGRDPAVPQSLAAGRVIVSFVAVDLGRAPARPAGLTRGTADRLNASTSGSRSLESSTLAAESCTARGTPCRSTSTWKLLPALPRSVGLGPVCIASAKTPSSARARSPRKAAAPPAPGGTRRSRRPGRAWPLRAPCGPGRGPPGRRIGRLQPTSARPS
jgi:hypothetical protein